MLSDHRFHLNLRKDLPFDVVGLGLNAVDLVCRLHGYPQYNSKVKVKSFERLPGGATITAVAQCGFLGMHSAYAGKVGSDDFGTFCLESMKRLPVDLSEVVVEPESTNQFSIILVDQKNGERTIVWDRDQKLMYRCGELRKETILRGSLLHLDGFDIAASMEAARWARLAGIPVSLDIDFTDPKLADLLPLISFLIASTNFPLEYTGEKDLHHAMRRVQQVSGGFVAVTLGVEGALALVDGDFFHSPAFPVEAIDTTGAGDFFRAGFLYGLWKNWPLGTIMMFANAVAAYNCTRPGAQGGFCSLEDVLGFLKGQSIHLDPDAGSYRELRRG